MPPIPPDQVSPFPIQRRVLRTPDAALYLGLTASTLEKMRLTGDGPRFIRLGARAVGYARDDLDAFVDAGRRRSTSDPGTPSRPETARMAVS
jgi:predicted DNA-binding transcriptional regulator AlpA